MRFKPVFKRTNRVFFSWILSYLLILLIPVAISMIMNYYSTKTINEEVSKAYNASLLNLQSVVDGKLEGVKEVFKNIVLNKRIMAVVNTQDKDMDIFELLKAQADISSARIANNLVGGILLHFNKSDIILSDTAIINGDFLTYDSFLNLGLSEDEWNTMINTTHINEYRIVRSADRKGNVSNKLLFIQTIRSSTKGQYATLVINLDVFALKNTVNEYKWLVQEYPCILLDENNNYIEFSDLGALPSYVEYGDLKSHTDNNEPLIRYEGTAIAHVTSKLGKWEYVSVIPSGTFLEKVNKNKWILIAYILVCLMIGAFASYYLTKKNYNPVKKLLQNYVSNMGNPADGSGNAFNMLDITLKNLSEEKENYQKVIEKQKNALVSRFLSRLLRGTITDPAQVTELFEAYHIELMSNDFMVVNFCIDEFSQNVIDIKKEPDEEAFSLILTVIENVFCELSGERLKAYFTEIDGRIIALLNIDTTKFSGNEPDVLILELEGILQKTLEFMEQYFHLNLFIAVSMPHRSVIEITPAFFETIEVIEYKTLVGGDKEIVAFDSINTGSINNYSLEKERAFIKYLHLEDFEQAKQIMNDILNHELYTGSQSLQLVKCRIFGLVSSMINKIDLIRTSVDVQFFEKMDPINRLLNAKTVAELQSNTNYIFDSFNEYFRMKRDKTAPEWIDKAVQFIEEHFCEQDLNVSYIADHLQMNASYLSNTFKKYMDIGILDYIHKLRLNKAKELMNKGMNLNIIAQQVGYSNVLSMHRVFKKFEGISPGRFKS